MNINLVLTFSLIVIIAAIIFGIKLIAAKFAELSSQNRLLKALRSLDKLVLSNPDIENLYQGIVDVIHQELGFTFAILALIDRPNQVIRRVAISLDPDSAQTLHEILPVKFKQQIVPFSNTGNLFAQVMIKKTPLHTKNLSDIQVGVLPQEVSQKIQRLWRLKSIFLYPVIIRGEIVGILEYSNTKEKERLSSVEWLIMEEFTSEVARALDNAFLYENIKQTTEELKAANERLKKVDQLKDDFVSLASHELRTPMTIIRSYAWMALHRADVPLSEKVEKYLVRVLLSAERLINLVNDMLNISRIESGRIEINPEPVDLISLCQDITDEVYYSKSAEKNIEFEIKKQALPKVLADPEKLRQVMLNIVGNSLKFSPNGGKITISFFTDGQFVETSISDQGPGISREDIGKLFQKFGRLNNSYNAAAISGGTGLGLFISKSLIDLMHGKIWVTSDGLGKGATFSFSLPVASEEVLQEKEKFHIRPKEGAAKGLEPVAI